MYNIVETQYLFQTAAHLIREGESTGFHEEASGALSLYVKEEEGYFLLQAVDSGKPHMTWQNLVMESEARGENVYECYILADDEYDIFNTIWTESTTSPEEKIQSMLKRGGMKVTGQEDFRLYGLKGRYLWVGVRCINLEDKLFELKKISISYPKQTFVDYLPDIYAAEDGFLERYIGIFQKLYLEMEQLIDHLPDFLEPYKMPAEFLEYIGSWIGIANTRQVFNDVQMRKLLLKYGAQGKAKGTKGALIEILEILTGNKPVIVEYFKWQGHVKPDEMADYERLYGSGAYTFTVLLDLAETQIDSEEDFNEKIRWIIEQFKPALALYRVVVLRREACLDGHTYLGVNTYLPCDEEQVCTLG